MTDSLKDALLLAALDAASEQGFTEAALATAAAMVGVGPREIHDAFPKGPASLAEAFSHWADARMEAGMAHDPATRMRERVTQAVRGRIEVLTPHKQAVRRAAAFLALPQHAPLAARLTLRTVDAMWKAAGDRATDFSYYTKRAMLSGVYGATLLYWLSDSSPGHEASWRFLDHRIEDVMRIEKFRGTARDALAKLPDPFGIFSRPRKP
jgi:ubiquinone biosynthesis protein COQ9